MAKQKAKTATAEAPAPAGPASSSAEYTVVARRYRPRQFTDLVGQEPVARALMNAIQSDRVAHAYLFTGVRGTGKTSTARILAKALVCEKGPTPTPCDQCEICKSVANGEDIDVLEIDGASNRGIDEVRAIRQNVGTRPSRARYKIYIIDEVHMLSPQAFNALLKTLEEPPPHVKFIFATTEVQKIPITILSRCQRFDFAGITSAKIAGRLKQVVSAEGMQADDEALAIIARRAGGSMRDAQSLLDQLLAFDAAKLTVEKVHQLLGTASDERMLTLVDAITARDAKQAVELLGRFAEEGLQLGELLDQLIEYWRCLMLLQCAGKDFSGVSLADASREKAAQHAQSLPLDSILAGLDVLTAAKNRLRGSNHGFVLAEMAVLRLIRLDDLVPVAQLAQSLSQPGSAPAPRPASSKPQPEAEAAKKNSRVTPEAARNGVEAARNGVEVPTTTIETDLEGVWAKVRETVGPMLAANLAAAGLPAILGPNTLVLRFTSRYTAPYDYCAIPRNIEEIQAVVKSITGKDWNFRVEMEAQSDGKQDTQPQPAKPVTYRERNQEVLQVPLVNWAVEKLGARLLRVDDGFGAAETSGSDPESAEPQEP
jgi:DNA polymerase III subunit gamma/tau